MKYFLIINGFLVIIFVFVFLVVFINGVVGGFLIIEVVKNVVVYGVIVLVGVWVVLLLV